MNSNLSYSPETPNSGQNRWLFYPCDLEIWRMTLKNKAAPLFGTSSFVQYLLQILYLNFVHITKLASLVKTVKRAMISNVKI